MTNSTANKCPSLNHLSEENMNLCCLNKVQTNVRNQNHRSKQFEFFKKRTFFLTVAMRQMLDLTLVLNKVLFVKLEMLDRVEEILLIVFVWKKNGINSSQKISWRPGA